MPCHLLLALPCSVCRGQNLVRGEVRAKKIEANQHGLGNSAILEQSERSWGRMQTGFHDPEPGSTRDFWWLLSI